MNRYLATISLCLSCAIIFSACSTVTEVNPQGHAIAALPEDCEVRVLESSRILSEGDYDKLGSLETHIKKNLFFGGRVSLEDALSELKSKACKLGGNTLVIDDSIQSKAAEMSHLHVWATVFSVKTR